MKSFFGGEGEGLCSTKNGNGCSLSVVSQFLEGGTGDKMVLDGMNSLVLAMVGNFA